MSLPWAKIKTIVKQIVEPGSENGSGWNTEHTFVYKLLRKPARLLGRGKSSSDFYFEHTLLETSILVLGLGHSVRGNMQYVLNELNHNDRYEGYTIYVRASVETYETVKGYVSQNHWKRTKVVVSNTTYTRLMESCKYLITETFFPENWVKAPGQVSINIWHGTPLKKLGLAKNFRSTHKSCIQQKNFINADYLLYPNEYTRDNMLASYKVASLLTGKILMLGYPRNGGMIAASQSDLSALRTQLAPHGEKIYAYMPTFRDYLSDEEVVRQSRELLTYLDEHLREDQLLYVNLHHRLNAALDYSRFRRIKKFPPLVDSYTLLAATDALITDYSSVFFDYLTLGRQIILHVEDYELYRQKRGTYMDLLELPFDKAYSKEEVLEALNRGKTYDDTEARARFCGYDSADNAKKLCQLFVGDESGLILQEPPRNDKLKTLIFSKACQKGKSTKLLHALVKSYDRDAQEVYIGCTREQVKVKSAFPMLFETPVIGAFEEIPLCLKTRAVQDKYVDGKLSFDALMAAKQTDLTLQFQRMYGGAQFDRVIIYDVDNPDTMMTLALAPVARKALVLPNHVLARCAEERYLADAVAYSSRLCSRVYVLSEDQIPTAEQYLDGIHTGKVGVIRNAAELDAVV